MMRGIIPACDIESLEQLDRLVKETCGVKCITGYKIGFELVIPFGMKKVIEVIRKHTKKPIIYDHQKAGTDVPFTGEKFAKACKGVDAVILFPQAGPVTEKEWIIACKKEGLKVIVGGEMTHDGYLSSDDGYLMDNAPERMYELAKELGVTEFVVPGNKPEKIKKYRELLGKDAVFYSPGLISQGGDISDSGKAAGDNWHAIVGRALYEAKDMKKAAEEMGKKLG
jgi:orotidine-5'-phosphate decarboxylase